MERAHTQHFPLYVNCAYIVKGMKGTWNLGLYFDKPCTSEDNFSLTGLQVLLAGFLYIWKQLPLRSH